MLHLNKENFEKEAKKSRIPVVIDFFADWCMPCRMMAPVFEGLEKEYKGKIKFAKINTEEEAELALQFDIRGIPALLVIKDGKEAGRIIGFMPEEELKKKINSFL